MKCFNWGRKLCLALAASGAVFAANGYADTVEYWDFENGANLAPGVAGPLTLPGEANESGYVEGVNGARIHGWNSTGGAQIVADPSPNGGSLALGATNQDGYTLAGSGANDSLNSFTGGVDGSWTIEMHAKFAELDGWETMFARMGSNTGLAESDIYMQRMGDGSGRFRLFYSPDGTSAFGDRVEVASTTVLETDTWYGFAAVADGTAGTVSLYVDTGSGYQMEGQVTGIANTALQTNTNGNHYAFFRDYFNGGQSNVSTAVLDNVRISDMALSSGDLIQLSAVPEPGSFAVICGVALVGVLRRRK